MADERDYRIMLDLVFPPTEEGRINSLIQSLLPRLLQAIVVNEGLGSEERGFISVQKCGHRLGQTCTETDRWVVGQGKVV